MKTYNQLIKMKEDNDLAGLIAEYNSAINNDEYKEKIIRLWAITPETSIDASMAADSEEKKEAIRKKYREDEKKTRELFNPHKQVNNEILTIEAVKHYYGEKWCVTQAQVQFLKNLGVKINNSGGNCRLYKLLTKRQAGEAITAAKEGRTVIINVN